MRISKQKIYAVDWYCNGFCYRTTTGCTWEDVKRMRRVAKDIGDTIKYEVIDTIVYKY